MTKTIYKYPINLTTKQLIAVPKDHQILCVNVQRDQPFLWIMIDPKSESEFITVETYGTGHDIECTNSELRKYIGTYFISDYLVFHVFQYLGV